MDDRGRTDRVTFLSNPNPNPNPNLSLYLHANIRSIDTLPTFKRHLNFHLFQSAFTSSHPMPAPQICSHDFGAI